MADGIFTPSLRNVSTVDCHLSLGIISNLNISSHQVTLSILYPQEINLSLFYI